MLQVRQFFFGHRGTLITELNLILISGCFGAIVVDTNVTTVVDISNRIGFDGASLTRLDGVQALELLDLAEEGCTKLDTETRSKTVTVFFLEASLSLSLSDSRHSLRQLLLLRANDALGPPASSEVQ